MISKNNWKMPYVKKCLLCPDRCSLVLIVDLAYIFFILRWLRTDVFMLEDLVSAIGMVSWSYFMEGHLWQFYCILIILLLMVLLKQLANFMFEQNVIATASILIFVNTGFCGWFFVYFVVICLVFNFYWFLFLLFFSLRLCHILVFKSFVYCLQCLWFP